MQFVCLWSDCLFYLIGMGSLLLLKRLMKRSLFRAKCRMMFKDRLTVISGTILLFYMGIAAVDSIHLRVVSPSKIAQYPAYAYEIISALDWMIYPIGSHQESTYNAPFTRYIFHQNNVSVSPMPENDWRDITTLCLVGVLKGFFYGSLGIGGVFLLFRIKKKCIQLYAANSSPPIEMASIGLTVSSVDLNTPMKGSEISKSMRCFLWTLIILMVVICVLLSLETYGYVFGTDKIGRDVFYAVLKSIRTAILIGTLTTLCMLPLSIFFGLLAGYFGGWVDDCIQYIYTTISSIPGVLLIAAAILSLQTYMNNHADAFPTMVYRADVRLVALCFLLGLTSWTSLCRILRGETLKLREMDYISAAKILGSSHKHIFIHHLLPNVMHLVWMTVVLDFSQLVLAEAVLTYVGVGVDPITYSFGNIINAARLELARDPVIWWPLFAAFIFMFTLVWMANVFADAVRNVLDPRFCNKK